MNFYSLRPLSAVLTAYLVAVFPSVAFGEQARDTDDNQIEVRLIPKQNSIVAGHSLEVRVEVRNVGRKPLFIEKNIFALCESYPLSLRLELGPKMKPREGVACAGDCGYKASDSFAHRLVDRWTVLPEGDFYGTVISINPERFQQLDTPGRWRLRGTYQSKGDLSAPRCTFSSPLSDMKEQVEQLPYKAWQGSVETNTVWIEVRPGGNNASRKRPQSNHR
jgi:hypothetical protein